MLSSRRRIIVSITLLATLFLALIGVTYAYYAAKIEYVTTPTALNLRSGYLGISYTDGTEKITGGSTSETTDDLEYTKTFTIKNDGVADTYFGIWINEYQVTTSDAEGNEVSTTFSRPEDWTYVLSSGNTIIKTGTFPTGNEAIITAMPLAVGESKTLTLTVTYNYITEIETTDLGLSLTEVNQTADMNKVLSFKVRVTQALDNLESAKEGTLLAALREDNVVSEPSTIPGQAASATDEAVLATTEDDYGISYYFRGNVLNNYVNFSGMCWRIVRVQGDGTIKLVLADRDNECNDDGTVDGTTYDVNNNSSAFTNDPTTMGFAYNQQGYDETSLIYKNSDIKSVLNSWLNGGTYKYNDMVNLQSDVEGTFEPNISSEDQEKLINAEWCNDTNIYKTEDYTIDETFNYTDIYYSGYNRLSDTTTTANPSLNCNRKDSRYIDNVGVLSADEIAFAGTIYEETDGSYNHYLTTNAGYDYYTLTPYKFYHEGDNPLVFKVKATGGLYYRSVFDYNFEYIYIRPSVVLKSGVTITTNDDTTTFGAPGTQSNPYIIN